MSLFNNLQKKPTHNTLITMSLHNIIAFMVSALLLSSCVAGVATTTGLGMYSIYKTKEERRKEKYLYKCQHTHKPIDAYAMGIQAEHDAIQATHINDDKAITQHMTDALEYYYIARNRADDRAAKRIIYLEGIMPDAEKAKARYQFEQYSPMNLESCYIHF